MLPKTVLWSCESDIYVSWAHRDVVGCRVCSIPKVCSGKRYLNVAQAFLYSLLKLISAPCFPSARSRHYLREHHIAQVKTIREYTQSQAARMLRSQWPNTRPGQILFSNKNKAQKFKGALPHPQELWVVIKVKIPFMEAHLAFSAILLQLQPSSKEHTTSCVWRKPMCSGVRRRKGPPSQDTFLALSCSAPTQLLPQLVHLQMQVMILSKGLEKGLGLFHDTKNNMIKKEALGVLNIKTVFVISDKIKIDCNLLPARAVIRILFNFVFMYGAIFYLLRKGLKGAFSIFILIYLYLSHNIHTLFLF